MLIHQSVIDGLVAHAREESPLECCGLLVGAEDRIDEAVRAPNLKNSRAAYLVDPAVHFATLRRVREQGRTILGAYHSHPRSPAVPSPTDIEEAHYPDFVYVIVSLERSVPEICGYLIEGGNFRPVPLVSVPGQVR